MDVLIASKNLDKIYEIREILNFSNMNLCSLRDFPEVADVIEDGNTLLENALKKASVYSQHTGLPTISDDTGLEVDALNGRPGVFSSRYAGEYATYDDNVRKLLDEMSDVSEDRREARFRCVAVFHHPDCTLSEEGTVEGVILNHRHGSGGFGYDPLFYVPDLKKTFAEMSSEEKNEISHRGKAFRKLNISIEKRFKTLIK